MGDPRGAAPVELMCEVGRYTFALAVCGDAARNPRGWRAVLEPR
jgi:hypothetical protein